MSIPRTRREVHYGRMMRCFADRPSSVDALLRDAVQRRPDALAIVSGSDRITYAQLEAQVDRLASNLDARGVRRGDRMALLVGNRPEFFIAVLAAARLGAIIVPMNPRQRRPEILHMLLHSEASALIVDTGLIQQLPDAEELPFLRNYISVGPEPQEHFVSFDELLGPCPPAVSSSGNEDDAFCLLYTSGTTGKPKAAVLTHLGVIHSVMHYQYGLGIREGDVAALAVPASHVTGLVAILLTTLRVAGTTVLMEAFRASDFVALVERERVNYTLMVPAMYNLCLLTPEMPNLDLSSWRIGGFGGAPMPTATIARLAEALPNLSLANIYGATETTSPASILSLAEGLGKADTVGRLLPCVEAVVIDPEGVELLPGERGELLIGGPMTIPSYWGDTIANTASFSGGFWRSGDIASIDADGYLRIHDRMKDVINRGGYKIYCVEVEDVLAQYPGIIECAVVGYPDTVLGERVAAFIRMSHETNASTVQIHEYCAERLSDYKVPEVISLMDQPLPRNVNGKIIKAELRSRITTGR